MLARRYNYRGPFDPELLEDIDNPYRLALLLETVKDGDPDDKRMMDLTRYLKSLLNVHGVSIINSTRRKADQIKAIFAEDAKKETKDGRVVKHTWTTKDGKVIKVLGNA